MLIIVFLLLLFTTSAHAQSIQYIFRETPGVMAEDIDDDNSLLINSTGGFNNIVTVQDAKPQTKRNRGVAFQCSSVDFTQASAISKGVIAGACDEGAFVRLRTGEMVILSALPQSYALGITEDSTVGGQYCTPNGPPNFGCTLHGYTWNSQQGYRTIDYIDGRPNTHTYSVVLTPIPDGRVLGAYSVAVNLTNETLEAGYWIYDNGFFDTTSLPRTFEYIGGPGAYIQDWPVVIQRWNDGNPRLDFFDDDKIYTITGKPADWFISQIGGSNKDGSFVGSAQVQIGIDPFYQWPIYRRFGFVATQAPVKLAKGNK